MSVRRGQNRSVFDISANYNSIYYERGIPGLHVGKGIPTFLCPFCPSLPLSRTRDRFGVISVRKRGWIREGAFNPMVYHPDRWDRAGRSDLKRLVVVTGAVGVRRKCASISDVHRIREFFDKLPLFVRQIYTVCL